MTTVFKPSHKRKRALKEQAEMMRPAKIAAVTSSADAQESDECPGPLQPSGNMDESMQVPRPTEESYWELESSDKDPEVSTDSLCEDIQGVYEDWIFSLNRDDKKMLAMMLYDNYATQFGLRKTAAAVEVGLTLGVSDKMIRIWHRDFISNGGQFSEYQRGKYERYIVIDDEEYKEMALIWIRLNSSVKGRPNMTAADFRTRVISTFLPQVKLHHPQVPSSTSEWTAVHWLHQLGFEPASTKKGVYIDMVTSAVML